MGATGRPPVGAHGPACGPQRPAPRPERGSGRHVVLVSGSPGSGKTSLAVPLAAELGFTLLGKDRIKEVLHDALAAGEPEPGLAWSRRLGSAAMELLWALAAGAPAVVLDANFWPDDPRPQARIRELAASPIEVHCTCSPEVAARRYAARSATRHPIHLDAVRDLSPEALARYARPVGAGPVITVDTTTPVDIAGLAAAVRALLPTGNGS